MSETIAQINTAPLGDTWETGLEKVNMSLNVISTMAVTVNSHANGGLTVGNGYVQGIFGATDLVANTLSGGTVETPEVLTITSNVSMAGDIIEVGDVIVNSSDITINGVSITQLSGMVDFTNTTIGTSDQLITYFDKLVFRGAKYIISVKDTNENAYQMSELLLIHDSGNAYATEYSVIYSNTSLGEFSANANSTHIKMYMTPTVANTQISGKAIMVNI